MASLQSDMNKEFGMENLSGSELSNAAAVLSRPANEFGNSQDIEMQWAVKAYHHAETYFNLVSSLDPKILRLTKMDDDIYANFRNQFPDTKVDKIDADEIKTKENKEKWRPFCEAFNGLVEEYNFASLIRADCKLDYTEANTFVVPKVQFLAIEIARNREGYNDGLRETYCKKKQATS